MIERKNFATIIELIIRIIIPMRKAKGNKIKNIILTSGNNCQ